MRLFAYCVALAPLCCMNEVLLAENPDNGSTLARRWCNGCHVVSGDQIKGNDIAPSFASIARRPDFNVEKLESFLLEPHPKMPNMALSPEEARDIGAFIAEQPRRDYALSANRKPDANYSGLSRRTQKMFLTIRPS